MARGLKSEILTVHNRIKLEGSPKPDGDYIFIYTRKLKAHFFILRVGDVIYYCFMKADMERTLNVASSRTKSN